MLPVCCWARAGMNDKTTISRGASRAATGNGLILRIGSSPSDLFYTSAGSLKTLAPSPASVCGRESDRPLRPAQKPAAAGHNYRIRRRLLARLNSMTTLHGVARTIQGQAERSHSSAYG